MKSGRPKKASGQMIRDFVNKPNREIAENIPGFVYPYTGKLSNMSELN